MEFTKTRTPSRFNTPGLSLNKGQHASQPSDTPSVLEAFQQQAANTLRANEQFQLHVNSAALASTTAPNKHRGPPIDVSSALTQLSEYVASRRAADKAGKGGGEAGALKADIAALANIRSALEQYALDVLTSVHAIHGNGGTSSTAAASAKAAQECDP